MESGCFCGADDCKTCRCLPTRAHRGQRGNRYVNRGDGRGGNAQGGRNRSLNGGKDINPKGSRDGSSWRDRDEIARDGEDRSTRGGRDGTSWRDRDEIAMDGEDRSTRGGRDGTSWRDRDEIAMDGEDRSTRGGRNRRARGANKAPLLLMPRGYNVEHAAWRGGRGRGYNGLDRGFARFPGNGAQNRGKSIHFGTPRCDSIGSEGYYEFRDPSYYDEGFEGYHDFDGSYYDEEILEDDYYCTAEEGTGDYRGYGTDRSRGGFRDAESGGGRGAYLHSRAAGRGQSGGRGHRNARQRDTRFRGSGARFGRSTSGSVEPSPDSALADLYDEGHGNDSEQHSTLVKDRSAASSKKDDKAKNAVGRDKTAKKIPRNNSEEKKNVRENKGNSSTSHNSRKSRCQNKVSNKCRSGKSRSRSNSENSDGSNRSWNSSDSSVNAKQSRNKNRSGSDSSRVRSDSSRDSSDSSRDSSDSSRDSSDSSRDSSDSSRKCDSDSSRRMSGTRRTKSDGSHEKSDSSRRKSSSSRIKSDRSSKKSGSSSRRKDSSLKKSERCRRHSDSSRSSSKGRSDSSERSDEIDSSNSSSRSSSASSSCSSGRNSQTKRKQNNSKTSQKECKKTENKHIILKDEYGDKCCNDVRSKNKKDEASKTSRTSSRRGERYSEKDGVTNSNNKFSETRGSRKDYVSSVESNETNPKRYTKIRGEKQSSEESSHQKDGKSCSSKNRIDAPGKITKIGNAYVMDGSDPIVLTEEEYKFIMGCETPSPRIGSIMNTTRSSPCSLISPNSKSRTLTEGDSQKLGTAPSPVIRYEWQFQDEQGTWITYGQPNTEGCPAFATTVSSDCIEKHYISDPDKQPVEIESNSVRYVLDFTTLTQTNKHTSFQRHIRRVLKRPQSQTAPTKVLNTGSTCNEYEWQFQNEHGIWIIYGLPGTEGNPASATTLSSDDIEIHYINDPSKQPMEIQSNRFQYILDFQAMTQTNKKTSARRRIRRVLKHLQNESTTSINGADTDRSVEEQCEWQFQDEYGAWIRYGSPNSGADLSCVTTSSSDDIDNHYCNDPKMTPFLLESKKHQYLLNFQTMTQTNLNTKSQRPIRRAAAQFSSSSLTPIQKMLIKDHTNIKPEVHLPTRRAATQSSTSSTTPIQKMLPKDVPSVFEHEWFFLDDRNRWIAYGSPNSQNKLEWATSISSDDIEKHYQQDPKNKFYIQSHQCNYLVNFLEMTQTNMQTNTVRIIRRLKKNSSGAHSARSTSCDSSSESMPSNWSLMPSSAAWTKVLLKSSDPEYTSQVGAIQKVLPNIDVVNMYRVQNKYLWKAYANKMDYLKQQFPGINYKEQFLYHGTDPAHVEAICKENVDWRLHGTKNGNSYGRGSYFSNSVQMSAGYSTTKGRKMRTPHGTLLQSRINATAFATPRQGVYSASQLYGVADNVPEQSAAQPAPAKALFIVRVLIGNITQGNSSTVRPPVDGSGQPYDTTVNSVGNPTIFVKYDTQEYYPEYYIEFD